MKQRLHGKVALISGAASGIGLATTELFCREGAAVTLVDTQLALAEEAALRLRRGGHQTLALAANVTQTSQVRQAGEKTVHEFGRLDVLFANAGIRYSGDLLKKPDEDWGHVIAGNVRGSFI